MKKSKGKGVSFFKLLVAIIITGVITLPLFLSVNIIEVGQVKYPEFLEMLESDKITEVVINEGSSEFLFKTVDGDISISPHPATANFKETLLLKGVNVKVNQESSGSGISILSIMLGVLLFSIGGIFILKIAMHNKGGMSALSTVNKSLAKKASDTNIKLSDVAGCDETKADVLVLVDFLKNPQKYKEIGARMPKGAIFVGPSGTGKTLLAKAIASEAGVPFYSVSGSDFIEKYVGVGASRVRDLFEQAKKNAPCIVFIDEIDAIGGKRRDESGSEQIQTINAILTEMDGFSGSEGVMVLAATNRLDSLDNALIRPGRFDRTFNVPLPDKKGRCDILKVHMRNKKFDDSFDVETIASMTIGFSGAGLENLLNEAAIIAATDNRMVISYKDVDDAFFKIIMKGNKKEYQDKNKKDIEITAYHEAGHTLASILIAKNNVSKVTVLSTTSGAGGVTIHDASEGFMSKQDLENRLKVNYAGRAAEEILLGKDNITTGASEDIKSATNVIRSYLKELGMDDELGLINYEQLTTHSISSVDQGKIAEKAMALATRVYEETLNFLKENEELLHELSKELIEKESLNSEEIHAVINRVNGIEVA